MAEARRLYEAGGLSECEIARLTGLNRSTMRSRAEREGWRRGESNAERRRLLGALRSRVDEEIAEAEAALGGAQTGDAKAQRVERAARTLASLVRTLRELAKFDEEQAAAARSGEAADDVVTDIDELRRELARRLESLRQKHEGE
ncbi:MAG: hypothetical protein ABW275_06750 [Hansschlegelia sp.]